MLRVALSWHHGENPSIGTNKISSPVQIRKKLMSKQMILEKSEKAKKLREQRKFGKKVAACFMHFSLFFL